MENSSLYPVEVNASVDAAVSVQQNGSDVIEIPPAPLENAERVAVYRSVPSSDAGLYNSDELFSCKILVPYAHYPYEPQLVLEYVSENTFAYRFHAAADPYLNKNPMVIQASEMIKPPEAWCLECGIPFTRYTTAARHNRHIHKRETPHYIRAHYIKSYYLLSELK